MLIWIGVGGLASVWGWLVVLLSAPGQGRRSRVALALGAAVPLSVLPWDSGWQVLPLYLGTFFVFLWLHATWRAGLRTRRIRTGGGQ